MKRVLASAAVLFLAACSGYSRDVDRTPEQVAQGLKDLDIREQPGAPGSDPSASGGIKPVFRREAIADGFTWYVMSGDKVAIAMTAHLTPLDGGQRTHVTTSVERGDAPDDRVSPAFRSKGTALALFSMAVESELDELVSPHSSNIMACEDLERRFEAGNQNSLRDPREPRDLKGAVGGVATDIIKLQAYASERRRLGCDNGKPKTFQPVSNTMGDPRDSAAEGVSEDGAEPAPDHDQNGF